MKGSMKRWLMPTALLLCAFSTNVMALGLGAYIASGSGDSEWERDSDNWDYDLDVDQSEFGFVLDTNLSRNELFNYRLNLGRLWADYGSLEMDGVVMNHSFGFGLVMERDFRIWAGPQLSVKYLEGDSRYGTTSLAGVGLGPVIGVNFNVSPFVTLSAEAGIRGIASYAEYEDDYSSYYDEEYDITESQSYFSLSVFFRPARN